MGQPDENPRKPVNLFEGLHYSQLSKLEKFQLIQLIQEYEQEIKELKATIALQQIKYEKETKERMIPNWNAGCITPEKYDPDWQGLRKVIYILKVKGRIMQTKDIKGQISRLEPDRIAAWGKRMSAVEKYIHKATKSKSIIKFRITGEGYFYGLPEWFENGELIKKFTS